MTMLKLLLSLFLLPLSPPKGFGTAVPVASCSHESQILSSRQHKSPQQFCTMISAGGSAFVLVQKLLCKGIFAEACWGNMHNYNNYQLHSVFTSSTLANAQPTKEHTAKWIHFSLRPKSSTNFSKITSLRLRPPERLQRAQTAHTPAANWKKNCPCRGTKIGIPKFRLYNVRYNTVQLVQIRILSERLPTKPLCLASWIIGLLQCPAAHQLLLSPPATGLGFVTLVVQLCAV